MWVRLHSHWSMSFKPTEIPGTKNNLRKSPMSLNILNKSKLTLNFSEKSDWCSKFIGNSWILRSLLPASYHSGFQDFEVELQFGCLQLPWKKKMMQNQYIIGTTQHQGCQSQTRIHFFFVGKALFATGILGRVLDPKYNKLKKKNKNTMFGVTLSFEII